MATAYLGLGTNVGNKRGNLVTAAALLAERVGDVLALSVCMRRSLGDLNRTTLS